MGILKSTHRLVSLLTEKKPFSELNGHQSWEGEEKEGKTSGQNQTDIDRLGLK